MTYQIKYTIQRAGRIQTGIFLLQADSASQALQKFDWELVEKYNDLDWVLHREFVN